jgi:hypothetical protein
LLFRSSWRILKSLDPKPPLYSTDVTGLLSFEQKGGPMLTGKKFKLQRTTLALNVIDGIRKPVAVPVGNVVEVVSSQKSQEDRMVDVLWEGQVLTMFVLDVDVPGTELAEPQYPGLSANA